MSKALIATSLLACFTLAVAQVAALIEFVLIPAPTPQTRGPQGPLDEALGLLAGLGGVSGLLLAVGSGVLGMMLASERREGRWTAAIVAAGVIAVSALGVIAFVLLGLPRNPLHPFVVVIVVPAVTLAYGLRAAGRHSPLPPR